MVDSANTWIEDRRQAFADAFGLAQADQFDHRLMPGCGGRRVLDRVLLIGRDVATVEEVTPDVAALGSERREQVVTQVLLAAIAGRVGIVECLVPP